MATLLQVGVCRPKLSNKNIRGLSSFNFVFKTVKMVSIQSVEMPRDRAAGFPLFTRVRFTGDAQIKMQSRTGAL